MCAYTGILKGGMTSIKWNISVSTQLFGNWYKFKILVIPHSLTHLIPPLRQRMIVSETHSRWKDPSRATLCRKRLFMARWHVHLFTTRWQTWGNCREEMLWMCHGNWEEVNVSGRPRLREREIRENPVEEVASDGACSEEWLAFSRQWLQSQSQKSSGRRARGRTGLQERWRQAREPAASPGPMRSQEALEEDEDRTTNAHQSRSNGKPKNNRKKERNKSRNTRLWCQHSIRLYSLKTGGQQGFPKSLDRGLFGSLGHLHPGAHLPATPDRETLTAGCNPTLSRSGWGSWEQGFRRCLKNAFTSTLQVIRPVRCLETPETKRLPS